MVRNLRVSRKFRVKKMHDAPDDVIKRIYRIYESCTEEEKYWLQKILQEFSATGESPTYESVWLADYKEIPVTIEQFISSDAFIGKSNRNGEAVYPYWKQTMHNIFSAGNQYVEIILTGATRIGKTSTAVTATAYMLYRLMCLRNPQEFFGKKDISKFTISFFNLTEALARGVAFREFNDTLRASPWFNMHGTFSKSERNFYYIPEGGSVDITAGSDASHALGQQVFCVTGDTNVVTNHGILPIQELCGRYTEIKILQYDYHTGVCRWSRTRAIHTADVHDTYKLYTTSGGGIEATKDHLILMYNNVYKAIEDVHIGEYIKCIDDTGHVMVSSIEHIHYDDSIPVYDIFNAWPLHNFVIASNGTYYVLHNCAFMDEMNFSQAGVKDVNKAKTHMRNLYNTVAARVKGTFRMQGEVYGKMFAVSSKRSDSDFIEAYVQEQQSAGAGGHMYIADAPQWEVLPASMFSSKKFWIAVGDRNMRGYVVPDNQTDEASLNDLRAQGYRLLNPPIDMRSDFLADFDIALRDLAGISVPGALSFITQDVISACIDSTRRNPFFNDILTTGTKDTKTLEEFFHLDAVPVNIRRCPIYIHLDLSLNTDRTGIGAVAVDGRQDITGLDGRVVSQVMLSHVFSIAIEAPRGDKIAYNKIVEFICWLRRVGFNIAGISRDQFQSEYLGQLLESQGFSVKKISLDRTPDGYMTFRSVLVEQRIRLLDVQLLQDELIHLQRDSITGKVDHMIGGSKDVSDGLAGAVWNALQENVNVQLPAGTVPKVLTQVNGRNTRMDSRRPSVFGAFGGGNIWKPPK